MQIKGQNTIPQLLRKTGLRSRERDSKQWDEPMIALSRHRSTINDPYITRQSPTNMGGALEKNEYSDTMIQHRQLANDYAAVTNYGY